MLSGLVSFPILTRIFSKEEYGILSLVNVTIMMLVPFAKFGLQNSSVRFYSEYKEGNGNGADMATYYATIFWGSAVLAVGVVLAYCLVVFFLKDFSRSIGPSGLFFLAGGIILMQVLSSTYLNFFRAEQRTKLFGLVSCATKYFALGVILLVLFFAARSVFGFFLGMLIGEIIVLICLTCWFVGKYPVHPKGFSADFFKEAISYGFPLIGLELASLFLAFSDRYLIQYFMGSESVGVFSVASSLCQYVEQFMTYPIFLAIIPIYMELWVTRGREGTSRFLEETLYYYMLIAIPVIFGFSAMSRDVVTLLASEKFLQAVGLIPPIITGFIAFGAFPLFAAGLFINKKTGAIALLVIAGSFLNIILNVILLPRYGLMGSAVAICASFISLIIALSCVSRIYLPLSVNLGHLAKCVISSAVMYFVLGFLEFPELYLAMLIKIPLGVLLYSVCIVTLSRDVRQKSRSVLRRLVPATHER